MSEVCISMCSGGTPSSTHKEYYDGNIPWLRTQEIDWMPIRETSMKISELGLKNSSAKWIPTGCVIIAMYGATAAKAAINEIPITTNQACCNMEIDNKKAITKYVYHWICSKYSDLKQLGEGSQSNINMAKIKNFLIPIPPLAEQERIVGILDRFEALTSDLQAGLPAEIQARRQQYEHYRDRLLTFPRR